jgi:predicted RNA-binding Zn ribbon-like protein
MKRQAEPRTGDAASRLARDVTTTLGGRVSAGLGIDVQAGDADVERWFLAATLVGTRRSSAIAEHAFRP